jgi:hypothetical protein
LPPASLAVALPGIPGGASGGNAAVLSDLKRLQRQQRVFGADDPARALADRFEAAQAQLKRVELLARAGEYNNARLQLREGAFSKLRLDLAYGQEMYRLVPETAARELVESVERLDGALKRRAAPGDVKPIVERMAARLQDVAEAAARMRDIS